MNEQNAQRFARLVNEAAASLGAGFATATAKKEANTSVSRAYEILKDAVFSALLAANRDAYGDEAMGLPYELRHVKAEKFMSVAALVGYKVGNNLQVLQDMRAAIAECPVVKKVKEVKTVADASKGEIEERAADYCHAKSVRYVVPTEEIGLQLWKTVFEIREEERRELGVVTKKYDVMVKETMNSVPGVERVSMS